MPKKINKLDKIQPSDIINNIKGNKNPKCSLTIKKEMKSMRKIIVDPQAVQEIIDSFSRTTEEIFSLEKLKKLLLTGRQLKMKFGVDVTASNMHIGHAVNLWMYRKLQELGHKITFLIGDFTTQIGDPTGKSRTRPIISPEEIEKNAEAFIEQTKVVLHDDPNLIEIRRNSEWYDKLPAKKLLSLMSMVTHDHLMSREMFRKRIQEKKEIYEHELIYPILQGYDSAVLQTDLTIIGSDQLYNEMMGRFFQEKFGQTSQVIITTKITPGISGKEKQSKSLDNYIGLAHSPRNKFGRTMSIPDNLIIEYFRVYTEVPLKKISQMEKDLLSNPMKFKLLLAKEIVQRYHNEKVAEEELQWFKKTFSKRQISKDIPTISLGFDSGSAFEILRKCFSSKEKSGNEIRRLIEQGAVKVNGQTIKSHDEVVLLPINGIKFKVGKRNWFKIIS